MSHGFSNQLLTIRDRQCLIVKRDFAMHHITATDMKKARIRADAGLNGR